MMSGMLDRLVVFHGEASTTLVRVYARLPVNELTEGCELTGRVVGPRCRWAQTLAATSTLVARPGVASDDALLAEAVVPDPCFWSDELPMLYDVDVELRRGGATIAAARRTVGFRGVGRRGRSLFRQGKRWVPRAMDIASVAAEAREDLAAWREAAAVMFVSRPSDAVCQAASETGVWLLAGVEGDGDALIAELARIGRHASVFLAVLPCGVKATAAMRMAAPNLLIAQRIQASRAGESFDVSPNADCVFVDVDDEEAFAAAVRGCALPLIAHRPLTAAEPLVAARRGCDVLQRDLATVGDYAGYVV